MYQESQFCKPPLDDAVIWRYMNFTKFVSLLDKSALFFARADKLGDPFEGSVSWLNKAMRPIVYKDKLSDEAFQRLEQQLLWVRKRLPRFTLISCWHESTHESAAMWSLYARETDGIAIKTDFRSFKQSLKSAESIYVGKVNYVDYEQYPIPEGDIYSPFLHKQQDFNHEQEVRAFTQTLPMDDKGANLSQDICDIGKYYEVALSFLIKEVIVAPFAPDWFLELVDSVAAHYNLKAPVVKSKRTAPPIWG